jgi:hypothetical protein
MGERKLTYIALEKMRERNLKNNVGEGPKQPTLKEIPDAELDLTQAALRFIHNRCEKLRFNLDDGIDDCKGSSVGPNQIPYNMQMDIDRLCLEKAVERFMASGIASDAFDVYFCYLEMFVGGYGESRRMIELLSEFETNASSLLMKHRDHYSHSVYVFVLGLAIYETNQIYRDTYMKFYSINSDRDAAHHYLKYWGLSSLFHDIGYPFELPYEQVKSYFIEQKQGQDKVPFIAYSGIDSLINLDRKAQLVLKKLYGKLFDNMNQLLAYDIANKLADEYLISEENLLNVLFNKPVKPDMFGGFMDHAYFSATVLLKELLDTTKPDSFTNEHIDSLTAIILHNSLYKFSVTNYKKDNQPFKAEFHPLAYMLMLCDELQCWDRTSYGRNSRSELHPMDCRFTFVDNGIQAVYIYDEDEKGKIDRFEKLYQEDYLPDFEKYMRDLEAYKVAKEKNPFDISLKEPVRPKELKLKAYAGMVHNNEFKSEIEKIVDLSKISLGVGVDIAVANTAAKNVNLSDSNFVHLYNFAVALNARYADDQMSDEKMEHMFNKLSLEYKMSNVRQAKKFAEHLNEIGCFYTDRPVAYEIIKKFNDEELLKLGRNEHKRWEDEKIEMCWLPGEKFESKIHREQTRIHNLLNTHYDDLCKEEQLKDTEPLNRMIDLLKEYDGLRIYRIPK